VARLGPGGDHAARRERHGVLIDLLAVVAVDAGRLQRERAAKGPAQVISLRQPTPVRRQQRSGAGEELELEGLRADHGSNLVAAPAEHARRGRRSAMGMR